MSTPKVNFLVEPITNKNLAKEVKYLHEIYSDLRSEFDTAVFNNQIHPSTSIGSPANGLSIVLSTQVISLALSSSGVTGALSGTDWNTFNSKESALAAGTSTQYYRGDKTWQTLDKTAVGLGNVENTALSTWVGTTNITTLGTIATGIWNAGSVTSSSYVVAKSCFWTGSNSSSYRGNVVFEDGIYGSSYYGNLLPHSGLTAARTWTLPNVSGTIATLDGGQTFTSAIWNAGSVTSSSYVVAKSCFWTGSNSSSYRGNVVFEDGTPESSFYGTLYPYSGLTASRTWTLPNVSGTIATLDGGQTFTNAIWNAGSVQSSSYIIGDSYVRAKSYLHTGNNTGSYRGNLFFEDGTPESSFYGTLYPYSGLTASRTWTLPNVSGTIATLDGGQTFTSAIWNGTAVITTYGGTGLASYTQGDLLYYNSGTLLSKLAKSTGTNYFLKNSGTNNNPAWSAISVSDITSGAALTKTDDTNVTLTLGGSPTTALLAATSLTLGWTGQLAMSRGGTGANLTDPNADRFLFWDDSAGVVTWLSCGDSVAITTTTLDTIQDIRTTASPAFVTVKCSGLTDGYIPYHVSDASGLANSVIYTDGTNVGIGKTNPGAKFDILGMIAVSSAMGVDWTANQIAAFGITSNSGGNMQNASPSAGGLYIRGAGKATQGYGIFLSGYSENETSSEYGSITMTGAKHNGSGALTAIADASKLWVVNNNSVTKFTILGNGNVTIAGTLACSAITSTSTSTQLNLKYDVSNYASFTVGSGGNLTIAPTGDFIFDPVGNDILPNTNYDLNIGSLSKKYLTLHAAELWVETLVAQNTMATIGGRILVGPTTELTSDLTADATTIYVKHNEMASGDRVYLEANGNVEFISIDSAPGGSGPYSYTVTRNLDGSGANTWSAGDAVFNTGTTGDGFIDIYSLRGVKEATDYGPTIVGNVRNSGTYNDWTECWAIGNLNGVYGYGATTYGAAFGKYSAANYLTVDTTNGIRFLDLDDIVRAQLTSTTWTLGYTSTEHVAISTTAVQIKDGSTVLTDISGGNVTIGASATENVYITSTGVQIRDAITVYTDLTAGVLTLGDTANEYVKISTSGFQIYDGATLYATYAATTTIGITTDNHISISAGHVYLKNGATVYTDLASGVLTLGDTSNEYVKISTSGFQVYDGANLYATYGATTTIGLTASEHISISGTAIQLKDGTTVMTEISGGNILVGQTGASQSNVYITSGAVYLRNNTTDMIVLNSDGTGTFAGSITSTATITGGTIQTKADPGSGDRQRIILQGSDNTLRFYDYGNINSLTLGTGTTYNPYGSGNTAYGLFGTGTSYYVNLSLTQDVTITSSRKNFLATFYNGFTTWANNNPIGGIFGIIAPSASITHTGDGYATGVTGLLTGMAGNSQQYTFAGGYAAVLGYTYQATFSGYTDPATSSLAFIAGIAGIIDSYSSVSRVFSGYFAGADVFINNRKLQFGSDTDNIDTNLYRSAANVLTTDDSFNVLGKIYTKTGSFTTAANVLTVADYGDNQVWLIYATNAYSAVGGLVAIFATFAGGTPTVTELHDSASHFAIAYSGGNVAITVYTDSVCYWSAMRVI
jgi:hypothetical protein